MNRQENTQAPTGISDERGSREWIGVDLDGTLAYSDGCRGIHDIGEPIPAMADRVRQWLREGRDVRIMTARVDGGAAAISMGHSIGEEFRDVDAVVCAIQDWTEKHFGCRLPVTNQKDYAMLELWDDRARQVVPNTGEVIADGGRVSPTNGERIEVGKLSWPAHVLIQAITQSGDIDKIQPPLDVSFSVNGVPLPFSSVMENLFQRLEDSLEKRAMELAAEKVTESGLCGIQSILQSAEEDIRAALEKAFNQDYADI